MPKRRPPVITADRVPAIIAAMPDDWLRPVVVTEITTGLRRGEILGLRWSDIREDDGAVRVEQQVQRTQRQTYLKHPKTEAGERYAPLTQLLVETLAA